MAKSLGTEGERIGALLGALSQRTPTPGGGAVAALAGAMGASLGAMIARYSSPASKDDEPQRSAAQRDFAQLADNLDEARCALLALADDDAAAYGAVARAFALPRDDAGRTNAIRSACAGACAPPLAVAERSATALELLAERSAALNANLASDLAICADLLLAAARGGERLTRVNAGFAGEAASASLCAAQESAKRAAAAHSGLLAAADART